MDNLGFWIFLSVCALCSYFDSSSYTLPKLKWECTARDARDNVCVQYEMINFPQKGVEYKKW